MPAADTSRTALPAWNCIAHELTHTIQQRETVQRQVAPAARDNVVVKERSGPKVQRGIVSRALDWIADKANYIPGFRMLTIVIGRNPINMAKVDRSGENILRALIEFIPGGHLIVEALENHGVMQKGGKFIEDQFAALGDLGAAIRDALMEFIDSLGWSDIFHLGDLWDRAKRIFTAPVDKAIAFGKNLVTGIATLVKDAIIKPLGRWAANNIPKWNLLVGVFGKNPISDEKESPASALIGAFMELIGQQEVWENIKKGNAVVRAWQWFQGAMKGALALVVSIPGRVISTLKSLTIFDIVTLVGAFKKIVGAFASFVGDFMRWAGTTVLNLLEIIFSVVAPSVVPYLKKAGSAFSTIIKAPGRFISTLVKAGKQGFNQFKAQIVTYLRDALFKWLLGSAEGAGIYFPKSFAPIELLKLGLSVLGLTWANIRNKLVAATNETTVKALETGFDIVVKLVKEGPAAAWEELLKTLSNLKSDGRRRRDRLREGRGRQDRDREAGLLPDAGGRVHPGDHLDLPDDHLHREQAGRDRPPRRCLHRQHRGARQRRRHRRGEQGRKRPCHRPVAGDQLPRELRGARQHPEEGDGNHQEDPRARRQGAGRGGQVDRRAGAAAGAVRRRPGSIDGWAGIGGRKVGRNTRLESPGGRGRAAALDG